MLNKNRTIAKKLTAALCVLLSIAIIFALDPLNQVLAEDTTENTTDLETSNVVEPAPTTNDLNTENSDNVEVTQEPDFLESAAPAEVQASTEQAITTSIVKLEIVGATGDLKDAEFGFFKDKADAISALIEPVEARPVPAISLKTDSLGKAESDTSLDYGMYFLRELKAPEGYELDKEVLAVVISNPATLVQIDRSQAVKGQTPSQTSGQTPSQIPAVEEPDYQELTQDQHNEFNNGDEIIDDVFTNRHPAPVLEIAPSLRALSGSIVPLGGGSISGYETPQQLVNALGSLQVGDGFVIGQNTSGAWTCMGSTLPSRLPGVVGSSWIFGGYFAGQYRELRLECQRPTAAGPSGAGDSNYYLNSAQFRCAGIDQTNGLAYFNMRVETRIGGWQYVDNIPGVQLVVSWPFEGQIGLNKRSANETMTNGNACYDLSGAVYDVYNSREDANAGINASGVIILSTSNLAWNHAKGNYNWNPGRYYVKERTAPKGYALDITVYGITVSAGGTNWVGDGGYVYDMPLGDPAGMLIQKLDSTTDEAYGKDDPLGLSLAGGEFTVKYWDGYYDTVAEAEASGAPTRTWVFLTEVRGQVNINLPILKAGSDALYYNALGKPTIPLGTVTIQETAPPPGYLLPTPNEVVLMQVVEDPTTHRANEFIVTDDGLGSHTRTERLNPIEILEEPHEVEIVKHDINDNTPLGDTEFTLYKETSKGSDVWEYVSDHTTDEDGKCVFSPVVVGSYKLVETRPNPLYATVEESGGVDKFFDILPSSTGEVQLFENKAIQISCEVYKQTIALTSSAFDGTSAGYGSNVGIEEYLYHFGGRSTANVKADEFAITDDQAFVNSLGYQMTTLWTGTSPAGLDHDNKMAILYKTNYTGTGEGVEFNYHPLAGNPYNANNIDLKMVFSDNSGWRIWAEELPTTSVTRLDVSSLGLAGGEYITGLKVVYGGVEQGFYAGNGWQTQDDPHTVKVHSLTTLSGEVLLQAEEAITTEDFYYNVKATRALVPIDEAGNETVMRGSIRADIARNAGVLTDSDVDEVQTRVIGTFTLEDLLRSGLHKFNRAIPQTGDNPILWILVGLFAVGGIALTGAYFVRRRNSKGNR